MRGDLFIFLILLVFKILALVGCDDFLLLRPMEERKVEMMGLSLLESLLGVICQSS